ncbi:MAG TPA: hypothetical protein VER17_09425 [Tepidisphaeraceae bacterium]|nr:hypothetical protein [Tepidisphaeraceae bacterium]
MHGDENDRLDEAMRRADDLLVESLRDEDRGRRRGRRRLTIACAAIVLMCGFAVLAWSSGRAARRGAPPALVAASAPAHPTFQPDVAKLYANVTPDDRLPPPGGGGGASLSARLLSLSHDWRKALAVGCELAAADPDAALAALKSNWSRIPSSEARQQILKAFVFKAHPRVLDVLDLGMNDPEPQVQAWAANYLCNYAFVDFAENRAAYSDWRRQAADKPLATVVAASARAYVERLKAARGADVAREARWVSEARLGLREIPAARAAAVDAGALDLAAAWLRDHVGDRDIVRGAAELLCPLGPDEMYLRRVVLPLLVDEATPSEALAAAADLLGRPGNAWAVEPLLDALRRALLTKKDHAGWTIAGALGEIGDPGAIPPMIAVIAADNTYQTIYGVGHFGLSKMTGVRYDQSHDGAWWKQWWERERQRFPEPARSATIPELPAAGVKPAAAAAGSGPAAGRGRGPILAAMLAADELPVQELSAGGDEKKKFFLIGPEPSAKKPPESGHRLLLVLPGGDGSAEFQPFVTSIARRALPPGYLVAELVAPRWSDAENHIVWPTEKSRDPKMKFTTEAFIDAVVADVGKTHKLDVKQVRALAWSSGGPAVYAAAMRAKTPITGSLVAMSVFKPAQLPPAQNLKGRAFYILHSPQDFIPMTFPRNAEKVLAAAGAKAQLVTYEGGHGWHGDVFGNIRAGVDWLEKQQPEQPVTTRPKE